MKKLRLLFLLGALQFTCNPAPAQCPAATNLQTSMSTSGRQICFSWNSWGATGAQFIPVNWTPIDYYGVTSTSMMWMGGGLAGIVLDTIGVCNTTIQWQLKTFCYAFTGDFVNDTANANKEITPVQSYYVDCSQLSNTNQLSWQDLLQGRWKIKTNNGKRH